MSTSFDSEWSEESVRSNILQVREIEELRCWAVDGNINLEQVDKLLQILRRRVLPDLPKFFFFFSIIKGLVRCIDPKTYPLEVIEIIVNADGIPLTKSGVKEMRSLAAKVHFDPDVYSAFRVAIFYGNGKAESVDGFLNNFIDELKFLQENGIQIANRLFKVRLKCFVCDSPARAFSKCTVGHNARNACERCTVTGKKVNFTTVYSSINSQERTDMSFRTMRQRDHHHGPSPLFHVEPRLNLVFCFVLDFMHLCLLGVMKRLIDYLMSGNLNFY
ncbi:uncharacterized protein LOC127286193 [Leptopilina boulardi]|uniref:uncharacterized protein LOC127286193 n=1 Tax=Leptopilina boulardi TaxID=63433 RepID=UPI0021F643C4|nr:uncharacterized protein LOC127286193 [Leptopilina boulardi]